MAEKPIECPKGFWTIFEDEDTIQIYAPAEGDIAKIHKRWEGDHRANAEQICTLHNMAVSINPENPMAVAEGMGEVIDALKNLVDRHDEGLALGEQMDLKPARQALSKITGGK